MLRKNRISGLAIVVAIAFGLFVGCVGQQATMVETGKSMVAAANERVVTISVEEAKNRLDGNLALFLDVRDAREFKKGHIPGAKNISRGTLEFKVAKAIPDKGTEIVAYCKVGGRGCLAVDTLQQMGYGNVVNVKGGFIAWTKAGYPIE